MSGWGKRIWVGLGLVFGVVVGAGGAWAATKTAGLAVSPAFTQMVVRADQASAQFTVKLSNTSAVDQNFRLSVVDFGSLDEAGGVAFLGQPTSELEHKYGLASWLTLEKDALFVPAGQSAPVVVTVANRTSLAPGGHYAAVLATAVTETGEAVAPGDKVGVKQVLSSLVLVAKDGGAAPDLRLVSQKAAGSFAALPGRVEQRFQNAGNVHVTPRGVVEIRDPRGKVVARTAINEASGVILPESFRVYKASLTAVAMAWMPGRYRLVSTYRYDGTEATKTLETGFWYVGSAVVWLVGLLAVIATASLAWWLWIRPRRRKKSV